MSIPKIMVELVLLPQKFVSYLIIKISRLTIERPYTFKGTPLIKNQGSFSIGSGLKVNSSGFRNVIGGDTRSSFVIKKGAKLQIGTNFKMSNSAIYCADSITIGDNVMIGGSCKIWDTDFHPLNADERNTNPNENFNTKPIIIGDNVFIGGFSIILKGVNVGDNSIVGASSVVSKDIPENELWAGNPAKFIKKI